ALPLRRVQAERFTAARCALIGDAAHVVHPLAGQGVNLGLLDAAALAECVARAHQAGEDPGAVGPLRRYERWRKSELAPMALAIDAFNRFLAHGAGPLSRLAQRGLSWVNRSEEVKRFFVTHASGWRVSCPMRRAGAMPGSAEGNPIDLRGADKIVFR
ncbi:ubiquinone biosynthesis hydroxylase, ubiH/ubiF/VisC/COQ6 family, partial [mine drainage metagenome]